jgi:TolB-like protein
MQWFLIVTALGLSWLVGVPASSAAPAHYEDSVKDLAETVIIEVMKSKRHSLAVVSFTDSEGNITPVGRFLSEEISASLMLSGDIQVLDRNQFSKLLHEQSIQELATADAETIKKIGTMAGVDCVITGTTLDTPEGLRVTVKVLASDTGFVIGGGRSFISKTGPIAELLKPPPKIVEAPKPPPRPLVPPGTPTYENEWYRLYVMSAKRIENEIVLLLFIENLAGRDFRLLCRMAETYLQDDHGGEWHQDASKNREGLCTQGVTLKPGNKKRVTLEFYSQQPNPASTFSMHFHEDGPRREVVYRVRDIKLEGSIAK